MTGQRFTKSRIYEHIEKLGFDVRPVIEVKMEREKLWTFGQRLTDRYPVLFESLVTGPSEFHIRKKLIFPGKGEAEVGTLGLTVRGPVFIFPRMLSQVDAETELPEANDIVRECLKEFRKVFPGCGIVRAGKVNDYIFGFDDVPGKRIIAERFLRVAESKCEDVLLKINLATEELNRSIQLRSVEGVRRRRQGQEVRQEQIFGVAAQVDFNNKDMSQPLTPEQISSVLRRADEFNESELYAFLNGEG